jgi:hypothetical protein
MTFQEMIESLYNLTGDELRALAWEALLISDGPDRVPDEMPSEDGPILVETIDGLLVDEVAGPVERRGFAITAKDGWETGINTMPDTPIKEK